MSGISFFSPSYLWAALFVAAVVAIHLLRRPRVVHLDFSTLRFFAPATVRASRTRQIKRLLLMLARILAVVALTLIFARPFDPSSPFSVLKNPQGTFYIWIDPTLSMDYREKDRTLAQRADQLLDSLAAVLPVSSKIMRYDDGTKEFVAVTGRAMPHRVRYGRPEIREFASALTRERQERRGPAALFLLSDFQQSTSASLDTVFAGEEIDIPAVCVSLTPRAPWNYSVTAEPVRMGSGGSLRVRTTAAGTRLESAGVTVSADGIRIGHRTVSVASGDTASTIIDLPPDLLGAAGQVVLGSSDPLPFDNVDYFGPHAGTSSRVLVIGDPAESFVISAALLSTGSGQWAPVVVKGPREISYDDIDSADLIVVNAPREPSGAFEAAVSSTAIRDKAILFASGSHEQSFGWSAGVLSRAFAGTAVKTVAVDNGATPVLTDTISALWRGFPALNVSDAAIYGFCEGLPGAPLLFLGRGQPLVTQATDAALRRWVVVATPLGITDANNLCETGFYVPFVDRLSHLAVSGIRRSARVWAAGEPMKNPYYGTGRSATLTFADGKQAAVWNTQPRVVIDKPGIYRVVPEGESAFLVPVRYDTRESELSYRVPHIGREQAGKIVEVRHERLMPFVKGEAGAEMSQWLWLALLLMLAAEVILWETPARATAVGRQAF